MWLLNGPFDGNALGELNFKKTKLLKTQRTYVLGRKDTALIINNKKVSHEHCEFIVGQYSVDDVSSPSSIPSLNFLHRKGKGIRILRGQEEVIANPHVPEPIQHGDEIYIVTGLPIKVHWSRLCCYLGQGMSSLSMETCAELGINIVVIPHPDVTHHLITNYAATALIAASLVSCCQLVKPEWLQEIIRLGSLRRDEDHSTGTLLEGNFSLPLINKYRPAFSPSLPTSQKLYQVWEPSEARMHLFRSYRFICVGEKGREANLDIKELIRRGDGSLEIFDIHSGVAKFRKTLLRGRAKEGKRTVLVGEVDTLLVAIGKDMWSAFVNEAQEFDLNFIPPEKIIQAVFEPDTSKLEIVPADPAIAEGETNFAQASTHLTGFAVSIHPEEPFSTPEPSTVTSNNVPRPKLRRAVSHESSGRPKTPEPPPEVDNEVPRPRRPLTRRVDGGQPLVTGLDDPSSILNSTPDLSFMSLDKPAHAIPIDLTAPTPSRTSKLKRRLVSNPAAGNPTNVESYASTFGIEESVVEPPLKKFKALFEASNPDRIEPHSTSDSNFSNNELDPASQTQTQTQLGARMAARIHSGSSLSVLREEEEESVLEMPKSNDLRSKKRAFGAVDDDLDVDGANSGHLSRIGMPATKKRITDNIYSKNYTGLTNVNNSVAEQSANKPPSIQHLGGQKDGKGAAAGKPDTDAAFLKAIASTKRGKKYEDEFDREFNKLKITKPDLNDEEPEKEWAVLADFGDDSGIRGNFMMILDMEVFRNTTVPVEKISRATFPEWQGEPNFKKFNKKAATIVRPKVDLFISEDGDYGIGTGYWKGGVSQPQTQHVDEMKAPKAQKKPRVRREVPGNTKMQEILEIDSEDSAELPIKSRNNLPSRAASAEPSAIKTVPRRTKPAAKQQSLFLESDEDFKDAEEKETGMDLGTSNDDDQTLKSSEGTKPAPTRRSTRQPSKSKKPAPVIVEDDSDDDAVFKGFRGKKTRR